MQGAQVALFSLELNFFDKIVALCKYAKRFKEIAFCYLTYWLLVMLRRLWAFQNR